MKTGIDSFFEQKRHLNGKIGLVTNHTGRLSNGILVADAIIDMGGKLQTLFSPEHGLFGIAQDGVEIDDTTYRGITTYSLHGKYRKPTPEMLEGIDYILFDIQELGSRFYTYLYTLAYVMEAATDKGLKVIVTDRPAPLGRGFEGNRITDEYSSFVGAYGLPARTGLTIGEYATYLKQNFILNCNLEVVKMENWNGQIWDSKSPWLNPSPNMPSFSAAMVYPGTCLIEATDLSEGRGTTRPFENIGAPKIDGRVLAKTLNNYNIEGVTFDFITFKPEFGKHKGEVCEGVQINVTNYQNFKPLKTGVALISTIFKLFPDSGNIRGIEIEGQKCWMDKLTGNKDFRLQLIKSPWEDLYRLLTDREDEFIPLLEKAILY